MVLLEACLPIREVMSSGRQDLNNVYQQQQFNQALMGIAPQVPLPDQLQQQEYLNRLFIDRIINNTNPNNVPGMQDLLQPRPELVNKH